MGLRSHFAEFKTWLTEPPRGQSRVLELKASDAAKAAFYHIAGTEKWPPRKYRELISRFRTNPIVRRATKLCAEAVASIEPVVRVNGREDERASKVLRQWLRQPNPAQDRVGLISDLAAFYKLSGNGWVEMNAGFTEDYAQFYALRPDRMLITPGREGWPESYTYQPSTGLKKVWPAQFETGKTPQVLHIKEFCPDDDLYGHGALEAADFPLEVYDQAYNLARVMFKNSAVPSGALVYDPQVPAGQPKPLLTPEQRTSIKEEMRQRWQGTQNAGRPVLLDGGLSWVPFSMSMVDLQAMEIRWQASRDIALAFGVPPMLLGIPGDNTYANFVEASRGFYRSTVLMDAQRIYGALARWWSRLTGIRDLELAIDEEKLWALADELASLWMRAESSQSLTLDEKRSLIGYDPLPAGLGTNMLVSAGLATIDDLINGDLGTFGDRSGAGAPPAEAPDDAIG